jgi:hypothetical protein
MTKQMLLEGSSEFNESVWRKFAILKKGVETRQMVLFDRGLVCDKVQQKDMVYVKEWNNRERFLAIEYFSLFVCGQVTFEFLDLVILWTPFFGKPKDWKLVRKNLGPPLSWIQSFFRGFGIELDRSGLSWNVRIADEASFLSSTTDFDTFFDHLENATTTYQKAEKDFIHTQPVDFSIPLGHALQALHVYPDSVLANEIAGKCIFLHRCSCPIPVIDKVAIECTKRMRETTEIGIAINSICSSPPESRHWEKIGESLNSYQDSVAFRMPMWRLAEAYINKRIGGCYDAT